MKHPTVAKNAHQLPLMLPYFLAFIGEPSSIKGGRPTLLGMNVRRVFVVRPNGQGLWLTTNISEQHRPRFRVRDLLQRELTGKHKWKHKVLALNS